jgi:hypothetical protein
VSSSRRSRSEAPQPFLPRSEPGPGQEGKEDVFEKVDPYTHGDEKALERAGYVGLRPFAWAEGVSSKDVRRRWAAATSSGSRRPHFRIGSTLASYRFHNDAREQKAPRDRARAPEVEASRGGRRRASSSIRGCDSTCTRCGSRTCTRTSRAGSGTRATRTREEEGRARRIRRAGRAASRRRRSACLLAGRARPSRATSSTTRTTSRAVTTGSRSRAALSSWAVNEEGLHQSGYDLDIAIHCVAAGALVPSLVEAHTGLVGTCPAVVRVRPRPRRHARHRRAVPGRASEHGALEEEARSLGGAREGPRRQRRRAVVGGDLGVEELGARSSPPATSSRGRASPGS